MHAQLLQLWNTIYRYLTPDGKYANGALRYTMDACHDLCVQRYVMNTCSCIDSTITFTDLELRTNFTMCGHMNIVHNVTPTHDEIEHGLGQLDCYFNAKKAYSIELPSCLCPVPCNEYLYQPSVSSSPWPHRLLSY